jgi:hypothetical protein
MTDKPWESAVSQVSLAGRTEEIAAMWRPWKTTVDEGGDLDWLRNQLETLIESVTDNWQGRDGAMFQQKAQTIGDLIDKIQRNYQTMWNCLNTSRSTLTEAKKSIPIPVFGASYLNGTPTSSHPNTSDPALDYGMLYHDYQNSSDGTNHYSDFKTRAATLLASAAHKNQTIELHGQGWGNASANIDTDYSINLWATTNQNTTRPMNDDQIQGVANKAAEDWYSYNAPLAAKAMETLRTDYAQQAARLPPSVTRSTVGDSVHQNGSSTRPSGWSGPTGSASGAGVADSTPAGGTPGWSSATTAPDPVNAADLPSQSDTGSTGSTGLSGLGTATGQPSGGGLGTSPGLYGGTGDAGSSGGGFGGAGDLRSAAGIGSVVGSGTSTEPLGIATDPRAFLGSAATSAPRAGGPGSALMGMPATATGDRQRDEHLSWLTEDEDVFGARPDDLPPNLT